MWNADFADNADEFDDYETSDIEDSFTSQQVPDIRGLCMKIPIREL